MLSRFTSGNRQYWTNSVPAYFPAGWATFVAADKVTVLAGRVIGGDRRIVRAPSLCWFGQIASERLANGSSRKLAAAPPSDGVTVSEDPC